MNTVQDMQNAENKKINLSEIKDQCSTDILLPSYADTLKL
jgi:hypothetical protein